MKIFFKKIYGMAKAAEFILFLKRRVLIITFKAKVYRDNKNL